MQLYLCHRLRKLVLFYKMAINTRSKKIVQLCLSTNESLVQLPVWETTKGLDQEYRMTGVKNWFELKSPLSKKGETASTTENFSNTGNVPDRPKRKMLKHLDLLITKSLEIAEKEKEAAGKISLGLGHTHSVHKQVYRLPDDVYQTAKISKLLLLMDKGQAAQYKGKTLDEINIDLDIDVNELDDNITDEQGQNEDQLEEGDFVGPNTSDPSTSGVSNKKKVRRILVPWTQQQKKAANNFVVKHINLKKPPKKQEVDDLRAKYDKLFDNKTWQQIKVYIQNVYTKK